MVELLLWVMMACINASQEKEGIKNALIIPDVLWKCWTFFVTLWPSSVTENMLISLLCLKENFYFCTLNAIIDTGNFKTYNFIFSSLYTWPYLGRFRRFCTDWEVSFVWIGTETWDLLVAWNNHSLWWLPEYWPTLRRSVQF